MEFVDQTMLFNKQEFQGQNIQQMLLQVNDSLEEKGYNSVNQIVGYLLSGDPAYIPRHQGARNAIRHFERDEVIEEILRVYLKANGRQPK